MLKNEVLPTILFGVLLASIIGLVIGFILINFGVISSYIWGYVAVASISAFILSIIVAILAT